MAETARPNSEILMAKRVKALERWPKIWITSACRCSKWPFAHIHDGEGYWEIGEWDPLVDYDEGLASADITWFRYFNDECPNCGITFGQMMPHQLYEHFMCQCEVRDYAQKHYDENYG